MVKVFFWINRLSAEQTAKILRRILRKKSYIKVVVQDNKCILNCYDVGNDPVGYIVEYLVDKKIFMGKYHCSFQRPFSFEAKQDRYQIPVCRFGWFDACLLEDMQEFNFWKKRFENLRSGMAMHEADLDAHAETGFEFNSNDENKRYRYDSYIRDLVKYKKHSEEEAKSVIDSIFPGWKDIPVKVHKPFVMTPEKKKEYAKKEMEMMDKLVGMLRFMSPKMRRRYLDKNLLDELRIRSLSRFHGKEWIVENIGEIPGYTDI